MSNNQVIATNFTDGLRESNYFNGRLLAAEDLQLDQSTTQKRLALLGQAAGYGVVDGLMVTGAANATAVKVTGGLGFTRAGQIVRLPGDVTLSVVPQATASQAGQDAGSFLACNLVGGTAGGGALDTGVYLLSVTPTSELEGQVAFKGAGSGTPACAARWETEGLQFGILPLAGFDLTAKDGLTDLTRRNLLAHWCYGTENLAVLPLDPFHFDDRYGGLDQIAEADLTPCDLPLAVFYWRNGSLGFLDLWSARRRLIRHAALDSWPGLPGDAGPAAASPAGWQGMLSDKRVADAQARFLQFQDQLDGMLNAGQASTVKARDYFRYLPPAGFLPIRASVDLVIAVVQQLLAQANPDLSALNVAAFLKNWSALSNVSQSGFDPLTFFANAAPDHIGILDGESIDFLLQRSWYDMPIDLAGETRFDLYLIRENWEHVVSVQLPQVVRRVLPAPNMIGTVRDTFISAVSRAQPGATGILSLRSSLGRRPAMKVSAGTGSTAGFLQALSGFATVNTNAGQLYMMFVKQPAPVIEVPLTKTHEVSGPVTIWHPFVGQSTAGQTFASLVASAQKQYPKAQITATAVNPVDLLQAWQAARAAGNAPDLVLMPSLQAAQANVFGTSAGAGAGLVNGPRAGDLVRAGMVLPLDALIDPDPAVDLLAYRSLMVSGKLYGVPHSFQVPGLYYKTDTIPSPPATTDALLNMVRRDLVVTATPLNAYPFCTAFGGQLMDANGRCIADQGGFKEAMDYWLSLMQRGAQFATSVGQALEAFGSTFAHMLVEGSWLLSQVEQRAGANLAVAPLPASPSGPARPLVGVDAYYVDANSANPYGAAAIAQFLTNAVAQKALADSSKFVPVRSDANPADPLLSAFRDIATQGDQMPQNIEFPAWWQPFQAMITSVLSNQVATQAAVAAACQAMNAANHK